jgi:hypothetical protein
MEIRPEPIRMSRRIPWQALVAAVLLTVAAVAVGASLAPQSLQSPSSILAAAGASAAPTAAPDASTKPGRGPAWAGGLPPGQMGQDRPGIGRGFGVGGFLPDIRITAITGANVSLKSANGWQRTIDTTGVTIVRAGVTITVGDLNVGDRVSVGETRGSSGTYTVNQLTVVLDDVSGIISKIDATTITVTEQGNKTVTVGTSASTVYRRAGQSISRSDLPVGARITAAGTTSADGTLQAESVDVQPDMVFGTVTKISGGTLTISTVGGGTATVRVTSATTFEAAGKSGATLADVAVNDTIAAQGILGTDGVLTATTVRIGGHPVVANNGRGFPGWKFSGPDPTAAAGTSS